MNLRFTDLIKDRLEEIITDLYKSNGEYALAVQIRKELMEKLNPIIMSDRELTLDRADFLDFQEYLKHEFTINALEQRIFYQQGYHDCVNLLHILGIL